MITSSLAIGQPLEAKYECMDPPKMERDSSWLDQSKVVREMADEDGIW